MEKQRDPRLDQLTEDVTEKFIKTTGYNPKLKEILSPKLPDIPFENLNADDTRVIENTFYNMTGKDKESSIELYKFMKVTSELFGESQGMLIASFDNMEARISFNTEINYICSNIPQLMKAIGNLASAVVYPNESGESGINIDILNYDKENNSEDDYLRYFRPNENIGLAMKENALTRYDIDLNTKTLVTNCYMYGYQFVSTIPYQDIAREILFKSSKRKQEFGMGTLGTPMENRLLDAIKDKASFKKAIGESVNSLYDTNEDNLEKYGKDFVKSAEFYKGVLDIYSNGKFSKENSAKYASSEDMAVGMYAALDANFNDTKFKESDIEDLYEYVDGLDDNEYKTFSESIMAPYKESYEEAMVPNMSLEKVDKLNDEKNMLNRKYTIKGLAGCKFDMLDVNRTIPIFIGDTLMGIYVVEENKRTPLFQRTFTLGRMYNIINSSVLNDNLGVSKMTQINIKEILFKDMALLLERNMDKKLLANNPSLIEDIFNTMKYLDPERDTNIRFIPRENLTLFKIGEGKLGTSQLLALRVLAHRYIIALKDDLISKLFLEKDRYVFAISDDGTHDIGRRVDDAVRNIRPLIPRISDAGVPSVMTATVNKYLTHILPLNKDGNKFWEMEKIEGMTNLSEKDDYLKDLLNQITGMVGYPEDATNPANNIDYATKIEHINRTTERMVIDIQKQMEIPLSIMSTKRLRQLTSEDNISVEIKFDPPFSLNRNITADNIANIITQDDMYIKYIDEDPEITNDQKPYVIKGIRDILYKDVIDIDLIRRVKEELPIKSKISQNKGDDYE